jgi:hypothetical protein
MIAMVDSVSGSSSSAPLVMAALRMVWSSSCSLTGRAHAHAHASHARRGHGRRLDTAARRRHRAGHGRGGDGFGVFGELPRPARIQAQRSCSRNFCSGSDCTPSASHTQTAIS